MSYDEHLLVVYFSNLEYSDVWESQCFWGEINQFISKYF